MEKTRLLAAVSHDLMQPLNAARLFSAALAHQDDALPNEAQYEYAARAGTTTNYFWGTDDRDATACQYSNQPDLDRAERPFYNLMMFPYPSAEGLHVGNMFAFTGADVYGRFKRLQGYDVFEPIGFDAFGIHSENYAIKQGINPAILIPQNIANFRRQLKMLGFSYDWSREVDTTDPHYFKWSQWIFLKYRPWALSPVFY